MERLLDLLSGRVAGFRLDEFAWVAELPSVASSGDDHHLVLLDGCISVYRKSKLALCSSQMLPLFQWARSLANSVDASWILLLINGEHSLSYSVRKRALSSGELDPVRELTFIRLLLSRKSTAILWNHRRWLVDKFADDIQSESTEFLKKEFGVCTWASTRYPRNYYTWKYRLWLLSRFMLSSIKVEEVATVAALIKSNPLDRSASAYMEALVMLSGNEEYARVALKTAGRLAQSEFFSDSLSIRYHLKSLESIRNCLSG